MARDLAARRRSSKPRPEKREAGARHRAKRALALAAAAASIAALAFASTGLATRAEIQEKQGEAQRVLAEIQAIDADLELVIEAYNGATVRLEQLEAELGVNQRHLTIARRSYREAQARLAERVVALYTTGEQSVLEVILGSSSLDDVIDGIDAAQRISAQDARIVAEVRGVRKEIAGRQAELERARAEQERVVARRTEQKETIERTLAERERLYESIKAEVAELEAKERERQRRLREEAERRLEEQKRLEEQQRLEASAAVTPVEIPTPVGSVSAPPSSTGVRVVDIAMQYLGIPYLWGGASPSTGFDCSGLLMYVYAQVGISLPHYAASQYTYGVAVSRDQLQPGDLVFFNGLGHNGMYIGNGQFIHAPHTGDVVKISSLSDPWYASTWVGARRIL